MRYVLGSPVSRGGEISLFRSNILRLTISKYLLTKIFYTVIMNQKGKRRNCRGTLPVRRPAVLSEGQRSEIKDEQVVLSQHKKSGAEPRHPSWAKMAMDQQHLSRALVNSKLVGGTRS